MSRIKDCLIVAAGKGTRIKSVGEMKPLVELCGAPLIEHAMAAAALSGVENFVVVTGYEASQLEKHLAQIRDRRGWSIVTVHNPDFDRPNGLSVLMGEQALSGAFYLTMCDHVVEPAIYERLSSAPLKEGAVALGVDLRLGNPDVDIDDVTKVRMVDNSIRAIGKDLSIYNAFDTGVFLADRNLFRAIRASDKRTGDCSISGGMNELSKNNCAVGVDVGDARWVDVDSPAMLNIAKRWLEGDAARYNKPVRLSL